MSTWEERMADSHPTTSLGGLGLTDQEWTEVRRRNAEEFPQELAERDVLEYCRGEGPPYCAEARPDGDSGRWMAFVTCGGSLASCVRGHRHHEGEIWMAQ